MIKAYSFTLFEDMLFCVVGPQQAPPNFEPYDPKGFSQFCKYLAKTTAKKRPKAESDYSGSAPEACQRAKENKQAQLEEFRSFFDLQL